MAYKGRGKRILARSRAMGYRRVKGRNMRKFLARRKKYRTSYARTARKRLPIDLLKLIYKIAGGKPQRRYKRYKY